MKLGALALSRFTPPISTADVSRPDQEIHQNEILADFHDQDERHPAAKLGGEKRLLGIAHKELIALWIALYPKTIHIGGII